MKKNCKITTLAFAFLICALGCEKVYASKCSAYCKEFNTDKKGCLAAEPYLTIGADELKNKPNYDASKYYLCTCSWAFGSSFFKTATNACKGAYKDAKSYKIEGVDAAAPADAPPPADDGSDAPAAPQGS